MDDRLARLAAVSENEDVVIVEVVYHGRYCQFDMRAAELKYLTMPEIIDRYFSKAFAAVQVQVGELGETDALALSSSSQPNVSV
jgi:allophanate hydrolase subunit 1